MKKMTGGATDKSVFCEMLVAKRQEITSALDIKFDTLARMGRVAEDDQAQISHDEFISLQLGSLLHPLPGKRSQSRGSRTGSRAGTIARLRPARFRPVSFRSR